MKSQITYHVNTSNHKCWHCVVEATYDYCLEDVTAPLSTASWEAEEVAEGIVYDLVGTNGGGGGGSTYLGVTIMLNCYIVVVQKNEDGGRGQSGEAGGSLVGDRGRAVDWRGWPSFLGQPLPQP